MYILYSRNIDVNTFMTGLALAVSLKNVELISHAAQSIDCTNPQKSDQICHQSSDKCINVKAVRKMQNYSDEFVI